MEIHREKLTAFETLRISVPSLWLSVSLIFVLDQVK